MEGFVGVNKEPEMASLLDLDPVEVFQVLGDVGSQSGSCVLDHLESLKEFGSGAWVECIAVVQSAGDEGMRYRLSGGDGEPLEDFMGHADLSTPEALLDY